MQNRKKLNLSDLFISGTSSPYKSPCSRISSIDMGSCRKVSATPDSKKSSNANTMKANTKWYMKGHKYTTIFQAKQAKPAPIFSLAGTTHKSFRYSNLRQALLLQQKMSSMSKAKNTVLYTINTPKPKSALLPKRSSSKNLQVDLNELESLGQ